MIASLQGRMRLFLLAFFLLVLTSVVATFVSIEAQKKDALVINLAGRQRMLVQQMTKDVLEIGRHGEQEDVADLQEASHTFAQTLDAFLNGGQVSYPSGSTVHVPATTQPDIRLALQQVQTTWNTVRAYLEVLTTEEPASPSFQAATQQFELLAPGLLQQADNVVQRYGSASEQKVGRLRWIQGAFFVSALLLLLGGSLVTQKSVVHPLHALGQVAERIGQGDLDTPVAVGGPQEFQSLARNFDTMRAQLKTSQEELQAWAKELEVRVAQRTQELAVLYEVSQGISSRLDIKYVLRSVTENARDLLNADVSFLCLLDDDGRALNLQAVSAPQEAVTGTTMVVQESMAGEVLAGKGAVRSGIDICTGGCGMIADPFRDSHLAAPLRVGGQVIGALCVGRATENGFSRDAARLLTKLAESAAIALENARLYAKAERVAALEERQRIAADIHDGLAQTLSYVGLKADRAMELLEMGYGKESVEEYRQIRDAVVRATQEVRRSIANLQETSLPRQALQDCLAEMVDKLNDDDGPPVDLAIAPRDPLYLARRDAEQVLRVAQEALLNARRHAQAGHLAIHLERQGNEMALTVEDDGRGFDPKAALAEGNQHFGLRVMRARANRIGGKITVDSTPEKGTRVILTWPLETKTDTGDLHPIVSRRS